MDIQKDTFVEADEKTTKSLTFDLLMAINSNILDLKGCYEKHLGVCKDRFEKLENQKKVNTVLSAGGGVIGGIIAYFSSLWGGK